MGEASTRTLRDGFIAVPFVAAADPNALPDKSVQEMMGLASTAREMALVASAPNPQEAAKHAAAAAENIRKTKPFNRKDMMDNLAKAVGDINAQIKNDPSAAQQGARRATKAYSAADKAAFLGNINRPKQ